MKLIAVFSFRYDYQLVPDLLENISFVDEVVYKNDAENNALWYHEGETRRDLIESARSAGADWIIGIDPDERFEKNAGNKIRELIKDKDKKIYGFKYRELWSPEEYRTDGIWGAKIRYCLFPLLPDQEFMNLKVHSPWYPQNSEYELINTDINLYHLKMANPKVREKRKSLYKKLDPQNKIQNIGYDYLTDENDLLTEKISSEKEYFPKYKNEYNNIMNQFE